MNFRNIWPLLTVTVIVFLAAGCGNDTSSQSVSAQAQPASPAVPNPEALISGMRLKALTKDVALTEAQKGQVQALFDEENKEITQINANTNLSITERLNKIDDLKKETYGKIRPLLTPEQTQKFDEMLSRIQKRKRKT